MKIDNMAEPSAQESVKLNPSRLSLGLMPIKILEIITKMAAKADSKSNYALSRARPHPTCGYVLDTANDAVDINAIISLRFVNRQFHRITDSLLPSDIRISIVCLYSPVPVIHFMKSNNIIRPYQHIRQLELHLDLLGLFHIKRDSKGIPIAPGDRMVPRLETMVTFLVHENVESSCGTTSRPPMGTNISEAKE